MTSSQEQGCVFCKVAQKKLEAMIVYEDKHTIGILDTGQAIGAGTCLVFLKEKHVERFYDLDDEDIARLFEGAATVAGKIKKALKPDLVGTLTVRQQVGHAHVIVFPNSPQPLGAPGREDAFAGIKSEPDEIADQIRRA